MKKLIGVILGITFFVLAGQVGADPFMLHSPSTPDNYSEEDSENYRTFLRQIREDNLDGAEKIFSELTTWEIRQAALHVLTVVYARTGKLDKAEHYAGLVEDFQKRWMAFYYLAVEGYARHGLVFKAMETANKVIAMVNERGVYIYDDASERANQKIFVDIAMSLAESGHADKIPYVIRRVNGFYYALMTVENVILRLSDRDQVERFLARIGYIAYYPSPTTLGEDMSERPDMRDQMNSISGNLVFYEKEDILLIVKYGEDEGRERVFVVGHVYTKDQKKYWQESR